MIYKLFKPNKEYAAYLMQVSEQLKEIRINFLRIAYKQLG